MSDPASASSPAQPRWRPLRAIDRRVAGVLVEKAKTTPSAYPMTLNAIATGCNQKSNRFPVMEVQPEDIEESLERLREYGAVGIVQGYGRVDKFRHYLYEWLGVEKVEMAVMTELLLRGAQTIGELRARAARMEPIRDQDELRPVLDSLKAKGLVVALTPEGRGQVVTHALYLPQELERLVAEHGGGGRTADAPPPARAPSAAPAEAPTPAAARIAVGDTPAASRPIEAVLIESLRRDMEELRAMLTQLQSDVEVLGIQQRRIDDEVREIREALGP